METVSFQISNVRVAKVRRDGEPTRSIAIIEVAGYEKGIVRSPKEIAIDMRDSGLDMRGIKSLEDPRFMELANSLIGGTVTGQITYQKVGDTYIATERNSKVREGVAKVGDKLSVEKEGFRVVDGFLKLQKSVQQRQIEANAVAYAKVQAAAMLDMDDILSTIGTPSGSDDAKDEEPEETEASVTGSRGRGRSSKK